MTSSRAILSLLLVIIGAMVTVVHRDVDGLSARVNGLSERVDTLPQPVILQAAPMQISKPRVPPIRHLYKKAPTVIDGICKCKP